MTNDSTPHAPLDLDALRAMATPAARLLPFSHHGREGIDQNHVVRMSNGASSVVEDAIYHSAALAEFIVAACNAVPALVDEVQALRDRLRDAEAQRDALLRLFTYASSYEASPGDWRVELVDRYDNSLDVERFATEHESEPAAAAWQQLIDAARAARGQ